MLLLNSISPTKNLFKIGKKIRKTQLLILNNVNFSRNTNFHFAFLLFYRIFAVKNSYDTGISNTKLLQHQGKANA